MATPRARTIRWFPQELVVGAGAQFLLLAALRWTAGLGPAGCLTAAAYAVVTWGALTAVLWRSPAESLGPANRVTLTRAVLVSAVAALVTDTLLGRAHLAHVALLVVLSTVALVLDAVDGLVARRTGTVSPLGARFDMEIDASLILVLSVRVAADLGAWVLAVGAMRYAFVVAGRFAPWLRGPLPPRHSRKTVAALQGIVLVVAVSGILARRPETVLVCWALALLVWSFGRDIVLLRPAVRRGAPCAGGEDNSPTAVCFKP